MSPKEAFLDSLLMTTDYVKMFFCARGGLGQDRTPGAGALSSISCDRKVLCKTNSKISAPPSERVQASPPTTSTVILKLTIGSLLLSEA